MDNWMNKLGLMLLAIIGLTSMQAAAQSYPNRPVKIVVPFSAGGPADNFGRFIAQRLHNY
jgi:tripartite-type tricarboxylate transporter receptor subunit TctC